jgi:hypothetical protein
MVEVTGEYTSDNRRFEGHITAIDERGNLRDVRDGIELKLDANLVGHDIADAGRRAHARNRRGTLCTAPGLLETTRAKLDERIGMLVRLREDRTQPDIADGEFLPLFVAAQSLDVLKRKGRREEWRGAGRVFQDAYDFYQHIQTLRQAASHLQEGQQVSEKAIVRIDGMKHYVACEVSIHKQDGQVRVTMIQVDPMSYGRKCAQFQADKISQALVDDALFLDGAMETGPSGCSIFAMGYFRELFRDPDGEVTRLRQSLLERQELSSDQELISNEHGTHIVVVPDGGRLLAPPFSKHSQSRRQQRGVPGHASESINRSHETLEVRSARTRDTRNVRIDANTVIEMEISVSLEDRRLQDYRKAREVFDVLKSDKSGDAEAMLCAEVVKVEPSKDPAGWKGALPLAVGLVGHAQAEGVGDLIERLDSVWDRVADSEQPMVILEFACAAQSLPWPSQRIDCAEFALARYRTCGGSFTPEQDHAFACAALCLLAGEDGGPGSIGESRIHDVSATMINAALDRLDEDTRVTMISGMAGHLHWQKSPLLETVILPAFRDRDRVPVLGDLLAFIDSPEVRDATLDDLLRASLQRIPEQAEDLARFGWQILSRVDDPTRKAGRLLDLALRLLPFLEDPAADAWVQDATKQFDSLSPADVSLLQDVIAMIDDATTHSAPPPQMLRPWRALVAELTLVQGCGTPAGDIHFATALEVPGKNWPAEGDRRIAYLSSEMRKEIIEKNPGGQSEGLLDRALEALASGATKAYSRESTWGEDRLQVKVAVNFREAGANCVLEARIDDDGALLDLCVRRDGEIALDANGLAEDSGW